MNTEILVIEIVKIAISITTIGIIYMQLKRLIRQTRINERTELADSIFSISDRWTSIYDNRRKILSLEKKTLLQLEEDYPHYENLINSDVWGLIRPVLNFYELIGVVIDKKLIPEDEVFAIVTVDQYPDGITDVEGGTGGRMHAILRPYVEYLRGHYRKDIYYFYDSVLLKRYAQRKLLTPMAYSPQRP